MYQALPPTVGFDWTRFKLKGLAPLQCRVRWQNALQLGLQFELPTGIPDDLAGLLNQLGTRG